MTYKVLSLGWGIQSFTLAAMSALDEFERPDVVIHADTRHESILTYQFAKQMTPWLEEHGISVVTVPNAIGDIWQVLRKKQVHIPAFTNNIKGEYGQLRRTCTQRWKIVPMRRWIQDNRERQPVEMWLGISTDEALRMKPSDVKYITNRWPLIELGMSRKDCATWLVAHDLEVPPKSACIFCPFHDTEQWQRIMETPEDWNEATIIDRVIRRIRDDYDLYVHPSRKPLGEVDLRTLEEMGQTRLWDDECSGICGV